MQRLCHSFSFIYVYINDSWGRGIVCNSQSMILSHSFLFIMLFSWFCDTLIKAIVEELWASAQWALTHEWAPWGPTKERLAYYIYLRLCQHYKLYHSYGQKWQGHGGWFAACAVTAVLCTFSSFLKSDEIVPFVTLPSLPSQFLKRNK